MAFAGVLAFATALDPFLVPCFVAALVAFNGFVFFSGSAFALLLLEALTIFPL